MSKTYDFLRSCNTFFVAAENNGSPAVRPFGAIMEYENELYISTGKQKDVYQQLKKCGKIQIVALKNGTRDWIRVSGIAEEVGDPAIKQAMLNECPVLRKHFSESTHPEYAVFKIATTSSMLNTRGEFVEL